MADHAVESTLPLTETISTQKEVSAHLVVKPLVQVLQREVYDLFSNKDKTSVPVEETGFSSYFNRDARNRRYYKDGEVVLAREDISDDLEIVAEFGSPTQLTVATKTVGDKKVTYLPLKHLCLVKKDGNESAIDLVSAWQAEPSKFGPRPIGLLSQDEKEEAVMGKNAILFKDEAENKRWQILNARGSGETGVSLSPRIAAILAGAKAAQKYKDIPEGETRLMLDYITNRIPGLFKSVTNGLLSTNLNTPFLSLSENHPMKSLSGVKSEAEGVLVRLERNALAATLTFVRQLRDRGFRILPEFSNKDLINLTHAVLRGQKERFGIDFG